VCNDRSVDLCVAEQDPSPLGSDEIVESLAAIGRVLVGVTARTLAHLDVDVTLSQYRTLLVLASHGPIRTVDLAAALQVHPSTATRACDRLVGKGLVVRHHGEADRRVAWLRLTDAGKDLVGAVTRQRTAEISQLVRAARVTGREPAVDTLRALVSVSGEPAEQQWWRRWDGSTSTGHAR
jgi:DNA-binding MarR family transcriptional regulator